MQKKRKYGGLRFHEVFRGSSHECFNVIYWTFSDSANLAVSLQMWRKVLFYAMPLDTQPFFLAHMRGFSSPHSLFRSETHFHTIPLFAPSISYSTLLYRLYEYVLYRITKPTFVQYVCEVALNACYWKGMRPVAPPVRRDVFYRKTLFM